MGFSPGRCTVNVDGFYLEDQFGPLQPSSAILTPPNSAGELPDLVAPEPTTILSLHEEKVRTEAWNLPEQCFSTKGLNSIFPSQMEVSRGFQMKVLQARRQKTRKATGRACDRDRGRRRVGVGVLQPRATVLPKRPRIHSAPPRPSQQGAIASAPFWAHKFLSKESAAREGHDPDAAWHSRSSLCSSPGPEMHPWPGRGSSEGCTHFSACIGNWAPLQKMSEEPPRVAFPRTELSP